MDQGLFKKHILSLQKSKDEKIIVILYIKEISGIELQENEVIISKKKITIQTTSVKRSYLLRAKIKEELQLKGYVVGF